MLCSFKRMIYPKNVDSAQSGEYSIALYTLHEKLLDAQNNLVREAKVVGHYLPVAPNIRVDMSGEWRRNAKHGVQFVMSGYKEVVQPARKQELYGDQVYRSETARAEKRLAARICEQLAFGTIAYKGNLEADIDAEQKRMGVQLAPEQRAAVKLCLTSHISIITGSPGTGKTLIQRAILGIFAKHNPNAKVVCCAPTGRAARRMSQCTGHPAATVHKALKLFAGDDGEFGEPESLDADLVLADEVSMLDVFLAEHLLSAVPSGSQLVLIGDSDQLPSVGPGAVLSELIACGKIPVVKLDRVYRQDAGSRIAMNAKLIRHGNVALEHGEDFALLESSDMEHSALVIELIYLEEVARLGIDNVALLTPFRRKTSTGVDALNERLREKVNPPSHLKPEAAFGRKTFRLGDKVMWTKNLDEINNGDIGYISAVTRREDGVSVYVDFGDGRVAKLYASKLDYLELAYATTVHKSQGSEYATVILSLQTAHNIMLKRPLLYTAITRAKERAIIVGERKALCVAINTADAQKRGTSLARRISELCGSDA